LLELPITPSSPKMATSVGQLRVTSTITKPPNSPAATSRSETYPSGNRRVWFGQVRV
jgi:hypothetical protein